MKPPLLALACSLVAGTLIAAPIIGVTPEDNLGAHAQFAGLDGTNLEAPEPLVYWGDNLNPISRKQPDGSLVVKLGLEGLSAIVNKATRGSYGELIFLIEVRNQSGRKITGALHPSLSRWTSNQDSVAGKSPQYMVLTSNTAIIGTLGAHKSWNPGSEFDSDVFATVPTRGGARYLAAVLLGNPGGIEHTHEIMTLKPGQAIRYELHLDSRSGSRNDALRETYRVRGGYRVDPGKYSFHNYNDPDLAWAKDILASSLNWAWDKTNLDPQTGSWRLLDTLADAKRRFGGYDAFIFWPFWPRAGFDDRSQFDHYRELPGGIEGLNEQIRKMHAMGMHAFISYCHWSESNRDSSKAAMDRSYKEFADLACQVGADGALMDLMSKTPDEILERARKCGRKLVPYNEGDPTWSDTQMNLLGRIHNDLPMPEFNLKKYMLPHHPQLRVCEPGNTGKRMRNDFVLSFFNGHGVEINTMFPGDNPANDLDWPILARGLDLLRTNRVSFRSRAWEPLIPSEDPAVWINSWPAESKTLFTFCGTNPVGHHGPLLRQPHHDGTHYVDLWRYRRIDPAQRENTDIISYDVDGFIAGLGSPKGSADYSPGCVGAFKQRMNAQLDFEMLHLDIAHAQPGESVEIWVGTVDAGTEPIRLTAKSKLEVDLYRRLRRHTNETLIIRLLNAERQVQDVAIVPEEAVRFFRMDKPVRTSVAGRGVKPIGMVRIPAGRYQFVLTNRAPPAEFPYAEPPFQPTYAYMPNQPAVNRRVDLQPFWIDKFPVTNAEYMHFVRTTGYHPADSTNFLKHFVNGQPAPGKENHPVVYVSYEDAKAYAAWAGKRLPTEEEWQFAAGAADGRSWPWGQNWNPAQVNPGGKGTDSVDAHADASPYGVRDLVGNIWQWTASLMDNGRHLTVMLRGGSWYRPPTGRWWVPGGPLKITENYPLPLDGPAMNRLATVGFRCVRDEQTDTN